MNMNNNMIVLQQQQQQQQQQQTIRIHGEGEGKQKKNKWISNDLNVPMNASSSSSSSSSSFFTTLVVPFFVVVTSILLLLIYQSVHVIVQSKGTSVVSVQDSIKKQDNQVLLHYFNDEDEEMNNKNKNDVDNEKDTENDNKIPNSFPFEHGLQNILRTLKSKELEQKQIESQYSKGNNNNNNNSSINNSNSTNILNLNTSFIKSIDIYYQYVIRDYLKFHSNHYDDDQKTPSINNTTVESTKYLIIRLDRSPTHGLGDRLRAIITGYFLSVISKRVFLIEWQNPIPIWTIFRSPGFTNYTNYITASKRGEQNTQTIINADFYHTMEKYSRIQTVYLDTVPKPNTTRWFEGPSSRTKRNDILKRLSSEKIGIKLSCYSCITIPLILNSIFRTTDEFKQWMSYRLSVYKIPPSYVSVHARLGYGINEKFTDGSRFNLERMNLSLDVMAKCFAYYCTSTTATTTATTTTSGSLLSTISSIYLATDTPEFIPLFKKYVRRYDNTMNVFHLNHGHEMKHVRDLSANDTECFMDTFLDLLLLSRGVTLYHLPSGFSDLAAWMGSLCHPHVITYDECASKFGDAS